MIRSVLIVLALFCSFNIFGQSEFKTFENGLIYSERTMDKLEKIVDSLNYQFKICDLTKEYKSNYQAEGHIVRLDSGNIKSALKDMKDKISIESFMNKYPKAKIEKNVLIVKFHYINDKGDKIVDFSQIDLEGYSGFEIRASGEKIKNNHSVASSWLYDYTKKSEYYDESLRGIYFLDDLKSIPLPDSYSTLVGYSDCLIDTLSSKLKNDAKDGWVELPANWEGLALKKKEKLLNKMRSTKVYGSCSMDTRPREHAVNIALLSAETTNWEVFLKSHLDIMNDRFERASDGSYAWGNRKTYIKELEELNINVIDLLIGISLRVDNPSENHYYGSIGRLGRAIAESKEKDMFEVQILSMIEDSELDDFNRVLSYFLFLNYNTNLESEKEQKENLNQLKKSIDKMPFYLKEKIKL